MNLVPPRQHQPDTDAEEIRVRMLLMASRLKEASDRVYYLSGDVNQPHHRTRLARVWTDTTLAWHELFGLSRSDTSDTGLDDMRGGESLYERDAEEHQLPQGIP